MTAMAETVTGRHRSLLRSPFSRPTVPGQVLERGTRRVGRINGLGFPPAMSATSMRAISWPSVEHGVVLPDCHEHDAVDIRGSQKFLQAPSAAVGGCQTPHQMQVGLLQSGGHADDHLGEERVREDRRRLP